MTDVIRTLIADDEPLARVHLRTLLKSRDDIHVIGECGDGRTAVERIRGEKPDLVLLDMQMPELDGLSVVREIAPEQMPAVIFVTAYEEYAPDAFEAQALDYLVKPVNRARFARALDRVAGLLHAGAIAHQRESLAQLVAPGGTERAHLDRVAVRAEGKVIFLRVADIDWIEAADDYVRFHAGKGAYVHRDTLARLEARLSPSTFLRIHRSTIVNVERIRELQPWFGGDWVVILGDGTRLTSGRSYRQNVRSLLERMI